MNAILQAWPAFLLVLCRISSFFVAAPVFSSRNVPAMFKIGLAFFVSLLVFLTLGTDTEVVTDNRYILLVIREVLAGLWLGFVAYLFFAVVQISGGFVDLQKGFGLANIIDPLTGVASPVVGNLKFMVAILVFLSIDGHHYLLGAVMDSYRWLPLENNFFQNIYGGALTQFLTETFSRTFLMALQIAAPVMVAVFLSDVATGLLARTAPQFNVFVLGIPLKILVGLIVLMLMMPGLGVLLRMIFDRMFGALREWLAIAGS
ncbi:MAG: flagellar biosynthetic protein FliR [Paenibacillaceae bacterium ZCTH02-B3]|nr:MAG: flagellar biosynthetic protein FliR [Paenibacillaceae bacterium ZCTH02-B3]